jgi:hypothetical protein
MTPIPTNHILADSLFTKAVVALFVLGTAIYIFPMGAIQPGHYLALIIVVIGASFIRLQSLNQSDKWLMALGVYTLLINGYYYVTLQHTEFLSSIVYWGYNIALFIALSHILMVSQKLRALLPYVFLICIGLILALWSVGYLRTDIQNLRFIGQFNDPNQMGHWLLCAFLSLWLLADKGFLNNRYFQLACLLIVTLLISAAGSRSATFGLIPLAVGFIWLRFFKEKTALAKPVLLIVLALAVAGMVAVLGAKVNKHAVAIEAQNALSQEMPLQRMFKTEWEVEAKRRGYLRPIDYPQYLLFGAGHGDEARFNSPYEIHASFMGVFFYYGIVGLTLFFGFLYQIFKRLSLPEAVMLSAPFVYGLFTYGLRTPIFWVLMAIVVAVRPVSLNSSSSGVQPRL